MVILNEQKLGINNQFICIIRFVPGKTFCNMLILYNRTLQINGAMFFQEKIFYTLLVLCGISETQNILADNFKAIKYWILYGKITKFKEYFFIITGRLRFQYPVLIRKREKYTFAILILFYGKVIQQRFAFHFPGLIPGTKNGVFRYFWKKLNTQHFQ